MGTQIRTLLVIYVGVGMVFSYCLGYALNHDNLRDAEIEIVLQKGKIEKAEARVQELRLRSSDRDALEHALRSCYVSRGNYMKALEDIKWQMGVVVSTCPGRERPPRLPRP